MKEIKSPIVIGIALVVMAMTGCDNKQQKDSAQNVAADSTQVENTDEANDKFTTKKITKSVKNATGDYELIMDFPEGGNDILVNAIREYISESLGSTYGGGEEESKQGSYSGELADGEKMADYYFSLKKKEFAVMNKEMKDDGRPDVPKLESSTKITRDYEDANVITYMFNSYEYAGGAHGGSVSSGMTFRKSDGRRIGWELFTTVKMQSILRNGLKEYFEVKTDEELEQSLTLNGFFYIPQPNTPPLFTKEGILVIYQQYEIAAYAAGMPSFIIPYNKAKEMLNNTGKKLLQ